MAPSSLGNLCELILKMYIQHLPDKQEWGLDNQNRIQMCTKIGFLLILLCHLHCTSRAEIPKNIGDSYSRSFWYCFLPKILFYLFMHITICCLPLQWEISLTLSKFFFTLFLLRTCFKSYSSRLKYCCERTNNKVMHRSGKLCFSRHQANKFHCKSISWFKLRAYSNMAKNFLVEQMQPWLQQS